VTTDLNVLAMTEYLFFFFQQGLMVCDEIVEFGTINVDNFRALTQIAEIVQSCVHRNINIRVKRGAGTYHELILTPKAWAGRGFLGCNVVPMDSIER
jgi:26S proteasome regulatory subunit N4